MKRLALILTAAAAIACTTSSASADDGFHNRSRSFRNYANQQAVLNQIALNRAIREHNARYNAQSRWQQQRLYNQLRYEALYGRLHHLERRPSRIHDSHWGHSGHAGHRGRHGHRGHDHRQVYGGQVQSGFGIQTPRFSFWLTR